MAKTSKAPSAAATINPPPPPVLPVEEPKQVTLIGLEKVPGGYVVVSAVIQGNRVIQKQVHNRTPELMQYAAHKFLSVAHAKIMNPSKQPLINIEEEE